MVVHCPKCSEHLEFTLTTSQLRVDTPATDPDRRFRLQSGDQDLRFRLPTTADQVALRDVQSPVAAREILRHRVCCSAERDGTTIAPDQISEDVWTALEAQIAELDKQADLRLGVSCMECGHEWGAAFDPMPFLWEELTTQVRMLCREVFMLAQHYGWSEAEILAMNPKRRQWYLELIG